MKNNFNRFYFVAGIALLFVLGFFPNPAFATSSAGSITLDRSDMYFIGHGAVVTVVGPCCPAPTSAIDTISITVKTLDSNKIPTGSSCIVTATETTPTSGTFASPVMKILSTGASCPNFNAANNYWIKAEYNDPLTFAETQIKNSYYSPQCPSSPGPCEPLQSLGTNYFLKPSTSLGFTQNFNTDTCAERSPPLPDFDLDGVCDPWEDVTAHPGRLEISFSETVGGIPTNYSYTLTCGSPGDNIPECPSTSIKDIFVEIDAIQQHKPTLAIIEAVKTAYDNSGLNTKLHYQLDEEINFHRATLSKFSSGSAGNVESTATDTDRIRAFYFGTPNDRLQGDQWLHAKRQVFHYALFIHNRLDSATSSGYAEMPGNDLLISLGAFTQGTGSPLDQSAAFMHELGHNLGLDHGGAGDAINCKPNYPSVMNYIFEFTNYISDRPLDYSKEAMNLAGATNAESALDERLNIVSALPQYIDKRTVYGTSGTPSYQIAYFRTLGSTPGTNWDGDGTTNESPILSPNPDINYFNGVTDCPSNYPQTLNGKTDWDRLTYIFQNWSSGQDGAGLPEGEGLDEDVDGDGFTSITGGDCDDTNAAINPDATEDPSDGVDSNCNTLDGTGFDTQIDNPIKFIAVDEGSYTKSQSVLDPLKKDKTDFPMKKGETNSSLEQTAKNWKLFKERKDLVVHEQTINDDLKVTIYAGVVEKGKQLPIEVTFTDHKGDSVNDVNYDIVATQGDNTILKETHYEEDGIGIDTIKELTSTSPVEITITYLGIGLPVDLNNGKVPKNNVVSFGIAGTTPEISYIDVMEIRHQTVLYLKDLIDRPDTIKPDTIKPESTKEKILEQIAEVDKFVKTDKIYIDKKDNSTSIDDSLDSAIQKLTKIRKSIKESQTDPKVKENLLEAVDDRIKAFAQAAEPANLPVPVPSHVKPVDYQLAMYVLIAIAWGIGMGLVPAYRRNQRVRR